MKVKTFLHLRSNLILIFILSMFSIISYGTASAQNKDHYMRIARLVIDSAKLDAYKLALREHLETAVRVEPGVLSLTAVFEKDHPTHITVFEIYASEEAYKAHLQAPHFIKYKTITKDMVKSLELTDVIPIASDAKQNL
ncbi:MAG TPA: antibiotic biosynthesis monooxygenase [Chitinophagaceae bacterium]|jgi:quinol monooxygenase YgiN